ncbi:hypothetical protein SeMB42_g01988 [Synchytrium endobioticum]|uniref:AH domain-containing protein n=1 Tax=Synchytrium endobioticum TaxID=286115 RepID=A0A507DI44_9FUNG|nr:hypothetical protein SeLEV6574_g05215 [Synchytrium endobioticum]TPX51216.1 hypothetical protein SeMB42_g01988 [Synchytrium endobioticum]
MTQGLEGLDKHFAEFFGKVRENVSSTVDAEKIEALYRSFRQSMREKLSSDPEAASTVKQPDVDSALLDIYQLRESYETLNRLAKTHADAIKAVNDTEQALAKFFQEEASKHPPQTRLTENLRILANHYTQSAVDRQPLIQSVEAFSEHTSTFLYKGIEDTWNTARKQEGSRLEYEGFLTKYQDRAKKYFGEATRPVPDTEEEMATIQDSKSPVDHALYQTVQCKKKYTQLSKDVLEKKKLLDWATETALNEQVTKLILARGGVLNRIGALYGNNRLAPSNAPIMNQGNWVDEFASPLQRSSVTGGPHKSNNNNHIGNTQYCHTDHSVSFTASFPPSSPYVAESTFASPPHSCLDDEDYTAAMPSIYKQRAYSSWK